MTMYGYRADIAANYLRSWSKHTHQCYLAFRENAPMLQQSLYRRFEEYHSTADKLREAINVAKANFENSTWKGFINVSLNEETKKAYEAWDIQDSDVWDGLASYGEKGYKFSLTHNKENSSWVATYTGTEGAGKNAGYAVSGYAGDPYNAARVLLFKVSAILPDAWKEYKPLPSDMIG